MENSAVTVFAPENPSRRHTNQAETAIERYRIVHTGPNTEVGRVKNGLEGTVPTPTHGLGRRDQRPYAGHREADHDDAARTSTERPVSLKYCQ